MVKVALFVRLEAKPGKETAVASFLESALPLANQEATTPVWFALRLGPSTFGIFDAFADEAGRSAHLAGPIAAALMANADEFTCPTAADRSGRRARCQTTPLKTGTSSSDEAWRSPSCISSELRWPDARTNSAISAWLSIPSMN